MANSSEVYQRMNVAKTKVMYNVLVDVYEIEINNSGFSKRIHSLGIIDIQQSTTRTKNRMERIWTKSDHIQVLRNDI